MKESLKFLIEYIEGDKDTFTNEEISLINKHKKQGSLTVYRGLSFESEKDFISDFNEEAKTFTYINNSPQSFSISLEQAEYFAQDLYSNFGFVFEIELDEYLDLQSISPEDFSHEKELLSINPIKEKVKILKFFINTKEKIGLRD